MRKTLVLWYVFEVVRVHYCKSDMPLYKYVHCPFNTWHWETKHEDVCLVVWERSDRIISWRSWSIPNSEGDFILTNFRYIHMSTFIFYLQGCIFYIYKDVISVCLFICPIITHEPFDRFASIIHDKDLNLTFKMLIHIKNFK